MDTIKSKTKLYLILVSVLVAAIFVWADNSKGAEKQDSGQRFRYLSKAGFEPTDQEAQFREFTLSDRVVYFRQRRIGRGSVQAIVQGEFVAYHFERGTGRLIDFQVKWRNNLPEVLPDVMDQTIAEATTIKHLISNMNRHGQRPVSTPKVRFTGLYYLSEDNPIDIVQPVPTNPCWIVETENNGIIQATIVDAVESRVVGKAVPPPGAEGFSLTGPENLDDCTGGWTDWYMNAKEWFDRMGYLTDAIQYPTEAMMIEKIQSLNASVFYELAHGNSIKFSNGCEDTTTVSDVSNWLDNSPAMPFTFLASCDGMCNTGPGTLSHAFRKGSKQDTATVGYCGMSNAPCVDSCWYAGYTVLWQTRLFDLLNQGKTIQEAFDGANADYPGCGTNSCMRLVGDPTLTMMPTILRGQRIRLEGDLTFGNVLAGQTSQRVLTIYNDGNSALTVSDISYPLGFNGTWSGTIAKNASQSVQVTFAPTLVQAYGGTVTVVSDKTSGTNTISCSGTGITNSPPSIPILTSPINGATDLNLTPFLQASSFSDPDGDSHTNSHWQIDNNSDFSSPEWDSGDTYEATTEVIVPSDRLHYFTTYFWRVRYKDSREAWSNWSSSWSFITTQIYSGGIGTETDPYQIATIADWQELMETSGNWASYFILMADLDLSGITIMPMALDTNPTQTGFQGPVFTGVFDGNGHIFQNVEINQPDSDYVGLFGYLSSGGQVKNLGMTDANIQGRSHVGSLCADNEGGTISECYSTGEVRGDNYVGGLCGSISNSSINQSYSICKVTGHCSVGGLCGSVFDCSVYPYGIANCYAAGAVNGDCNVGGLVGEVYNSSGAILASFWDEETSGQATSEGGTSKTTAQMQDIQTYLSAGWDFSGEIANGTEDFWFIYNGQNYPRLRCMYRHLPDLNKDIVINMKDFAILASQWGTNRLLDRTIMCGDAVVDGQLTEWPDPAQWLLLDQVYEGEPADVADVRYSLRWDANRSKVYAIILVTDTDHVFSDEFGIWDGSDRLEVYCQGNTAAGTDWRNVFDVAQEYQVGPGTANRANPQLWTDYEVECQLRSEGLNDCGIMFRVQDENNYYRFSWNSQAEYSRLVKVEQGVATLLESRPVGYVRNQTYLLRVVAHESTLQVFVDDALWMVGDDETFQEGTIALYCWGNAPGTYFDNLIVRQIPNQEQPETVILLDKDFDAGDLTGWIVVDQGSLMAPSDWHISNGELAQTSHIYSNPTSPSTVRKEGTFLRYDWRGVKQWASWADGQPLVPDVGLEYAVSTKGDSIIYELAVPVFESYGGLTEEANVVSKLVPGKVIGFDLIALTRTAEGGFGMLSENLMRNKSQDASQFAQYQLLDVNGGCGASGADLDGDCLVALSDLVIMAEVWLFL